MQKSPNDIKLSDTRLGRDCCVAVERRRQEAAGVTETRVRCSAWLGHSFCVESSANQRPGTVALSGDNRVTCDPKLAATKRMARSKVEKRDSVKRVRTLCRQKLRFACDVEAVTPKALLD